ncbi:MAG: sulfatase-like hydrolase/transferase [Spirochaetaceae bacterium]|nr:MAG: sulfatase-like hydrolase/transferase [Spirochaetaceae bacterium]
MADQPNIILILTDHFRPDALGSSTPKLMSLAERGVQFANAYCASPLCQPARASIITGKFPSQHGICGNQAGPIRSDLRATTFMSHLQQAGYYTALIGKHHFLDRFGIGMDVTEDDELIKGCGFDSVLQVVDDDENVHNDDAYTHHLQEKGLTEKFRRVFDELAWECKPHPFAEEDTPDGFIGHRGVEFIEDYDSSQPLYLNLSFIGPHPPYWHPGELRHDPEAMSEPIGATTDGPVRRGSVKYQALSLTAKQNRAHYMDKCALIDRWIGKLINALKQRGMLDDTLIVFTSDHGDNLGDFGIWDKRFFYEQCVGIPLILAGPVIRGGDRRSGRRISKALVSHLDLYPTFLELAGASRKYDYTFWGLSLASLLRAEAGTQHYAVFAELASALMSPRLFGEFVAPAIHEMARSFDTSVIHLHPSTYIPVEYLVETSLSAIELHIDFGGPRAEELLPYYRKILEHKPLIIWGDLAPEDFDFIASKLDRRALALLPVVDSQEQADQIWSRFKR